MAVPDVIAAFVSGMQASADYEAGIRSPLLWLMGGKPCALAYVAPTVALTQGVFTEVTFDGTVDANVGGLLSAGVITATEPGLYIAASALRISSVRGNKELRLSKNGAFDDGDPWASALNQFGVATPAFSSLVGFGAAVLDPGDTLSVGAFVDTPETCEVLAGVVFGAYFQRVDL